jgi:hypothetical protein
MSCNVLCGCDDMSRDLPLNMSFDLPLDLLLDTSPGTPIAASCDVCEE